MTQQKAWLKLPHLIQRTQIIINLQRYSCV